MGFLHPDVLMPQLCFAPCCMSGTDESDVDEYVFNVGGLHGVVGMTHASQATGVLMVIQNCYWVLCNAFCSSAAGGHLYCSAILLAMCCVTVLA